MSEFSFSQSNNIIDSTNFDTVLNNAEAYKELVFKGDVYKKFVSKERTFLNVERITFVKVENLVLAESFADFQNLKELSIVNSNNVNLAKNFEVISRLKKLKIFELTNSNLKDITDKIILLNNTSIQEISFSNNKIECLPKTINQLKVLSLNLRINPIREKMFKLLSGNSYIEELFLDQCNIDSFPKELKTMSNLKLLSLTFNEIKDIASSYEGFQKLELLNLTGNPIKSEDVQKIRFLENEDVFIDFVRSK